MERRVNKPWNKLRQGKKLERIYYYNIIVTLLSPCRYGVGH